MNHLTHEQLSDLLIADPIVCDIDCELDLPQLVSASEIDAHLETCAACQSELATLRGAITGLRQASTLHAASVANFRRSQPAPASRRATMGYRQLALWSATAAALVVTLSVPLTNHYRQPAEATVTTATVHAPLPQPPAAHTIESDEALLTSIDQDLAASIPTSMQPLADPTASASTDSTK